MVLISYIHFFAFISYVYLSIIVFLRSPKSPLTISLGAFVASLALWSLQHTILHYVWASLEAVQLSVNVSSFGWIGLGGLFLCFVLVFTGQIAALRSGWFWGCVIFPAFLLVIQQWRGHIVSAFIKQSYGWAAVLPQTFWFLVYTAYYLIAMSVALWLLYRTAQTSKNKIKRTQARVMFWLGLVCIVMASVSHTLLPMLRVYSIPPLGDVIGLIWAFGLCYVIFKKKLLEISPSMAAENILN